MARRLAHLAVGVLEYLADVDSDVLRATREEDGLVRDAEDGSRGDALEIQQVTRGLGERLAVADESGVRDEVTTLDVSVGDRLDRKSVV